MRTKRQPTDEQRAAAAEKRERFRELAARIAEMTDEQRAGILERCGAIVNCEGRALSLTNTLLVVMQTPGASMVGGFHQWQRVRRKVKAGATGIPIWIPCMSGPKGAETLTVDANGRKRFIMGYVFDVTSTEPIG